MSSVSGVPTASLQSPSDVLMTPLTPLPSTKGVAVRFTLFMVGPWKNVPFNVNANGSPVLSIPLTGNDQFRQIELQFPSSGCGSPNSGAGSPNSGAGSPNSGAGSPNSGAGSPTSGFGSPIMLSFSAAKPENCAEPCDFKWTIGQVAISYSNVAPGSIYNTATNAPSKLVNSYFTPLLGIYSPGQFVGYPQQQQPNWLTYVLNGQYSTPVDIIAVNGSPLNLDTSSIPALSSIANGYPKFKS